MSLFVPARGIVPPFLLHPRILLFFVLLLQVFFYLWAQPVFEGSDDLAYSTLANDIAQNRFQINPHPFAHRFSVLVPTALLFRLFGVNAYTTTLWPLFCALFLTMAVYWFSSRLFDKTAALFGAFLLAVNPFQVKYSMILTPDVVLSLCFFLAGGLLLFGRRAETTQGQVGFGMLFVLAFTGGVLAKMPMVWLAPFVLFFMVADLKKGRNIPLWLAVSLGGLVFGGGYFAAYHVYTGDFLYRLSGIEGMQDLDHLNPQQQRVYLVGKPMSAYVYRLTYGPVVLIFSTMGLGLAVVLALPVLLHAVRPLPQLPAGTGYWTALFLTFLGFFWLGSHTTAYYNPLGLFSYYLLPLLPSLSLLAGVLLARLYGGEQMGDAANRPLLLALTALLAITIPVLYRMGYYKFPFILAVFPLLLLLASHYSPARAWLAFPGYRQGLTLVLVVCLAAIPVPFIRQQRIGSTAMQYAERFIVAKHLSRLSEPALVYSDRRTIMVVPYLLGFPEAGTLTPVNWNFPREDPADVNKKRFVLINSPRLRAMLGTYGNKTPAFVMFPPKAWSLVVSRGGVSLYEVERGTRAFP